MIKCPNCDGEVLLRATNELGKETAPYVCGSCHVWFTEWQQDEIDKKDAEIERLNKLVAGDDYVNELLERDKEIERLRKALYEIKSIAAKSANSWNFIGKNSYRIAAETLKPEVDDGNR